MILLIVDVVIVYSIYNNWSMSIYVIVLQRYNAIPL
jgi:hypothetical protein